MKGVSLAALAGGIHCSGLGGGGKGQLKAEVGAGEESMESPELCSIPLAWPGLEVRPACCARLHGAQKGLFALESPL